MLALSHQFDNAQTSSLALKVGYEQEWRGHTLVGVSEMQARKMGGSYKVKAVRRRVGKAGSITELRVRRRRPIQALPVESAQYMSAADISDEELAEFDMGQ